MRFERLFALVPPLLCGCLDVNRPNTLAYDTHESYRDEDPLGTGNRVTAQWRRNFPDPSSLDFQYSERLEGQGYPDTLRDELILYLDTAPDFRRGRDPVEHGGLRIRFLTWFAQADSAWERVSEMRVEARGEGGAWIQRANRRFTWNNGYASDGGVFVPGFRFGFTATLPAEWLGHASALGWRFVRSGEGVAMAIPRVPGLYIRDEARFRSELYP